MVGYTTLMDSFRPASTQIRATTIPATMLQKDPFALAFFQNIPASTEKLKGAVTT